MPTEKRFAMRSHMPGGCRNRRVTSIPQFRQPSALDFAGAACFPAGQTTMRKINTNDLPELIWQSTKGTFQSAGKQVSEALGWNVDSASARDRHPFVVEILRVPPGQKPYPFHSHSAQWEFYHVISGRGLARHDDGNTPIAAGDAFIFGPGEAHQLINDSSEDLVVYVIADDPVGESGYYPDSGKWIVRSPERRLLRGDSLDYYDGEE